jgi:hypothetical protein
LRKYIASIRLIVFSLFLSCLSEGQFLFRAQNLIPFNAISANIRRVSSFEALQSAMKYVPMIYSSIPFPLYLFGYLSVNLNLINFYAW